MRFSRFLQFKFWTAGPEQTAKEEIEDEIADGHGGYAGVIRDICSEDRDYCAREEKNDDHVVEECEAVMGEGA